MIRPARNLAATPFVEIRVRVTPRGGRDAVIGIRATDGVLLVRVAAAPVDGAANRACVAVVARALGVRQADVMLVAGETSRDKRLRITGISDADRDARLAAQPQIGDRGDPENETVE